MSADVSVSIIISSFVLLFEVYSINIFTWN